MPPKQSRTASKNEVNAAKASSRLKTKFTQNKLDFTSQTTRPFGSRPLTLTPSFSLPDSESAAAGHSTPALPRQITKPSLTTSVTEQALPAVSNLWSEQLAPTTTDELAVHPRKVQDVCRWLTEALNGDATRAKSRKILTLTGPAGSGKSAVVRALASASELDYQLLEWTNEASTFDLSTYETGSSFVERFSDFLQKGSKFPSLSIHPDQHPAEAASSSSTAPIPKRRVVLIEDIPNIHHLSTRQLFQATLEHHLEQSIALSERGLLNVPIVIIVTECTPRDDQDRWLGDASSGNWRERLNSVMDTRTALSERLRLHPAHTEIRFNPVAPTILVSGLKRALERQATELDKVKAGSLPSDIVQAIAKDATGDIRAAVNCLQFAFANSTRPFAKRHKGLTVAERKKILHNLMPLISGRATSLALFHAIGRVLYNKRLGDPGTEDDDSKDKSLHQERATSGGDGDECSDFDGLAVKHRLKAAMGNMGLPSQDDSGNIDYALPESLSHLERRTSRVDVNQLWADLPVDASVFQLYLHQNYLQFTTDLDECVSIIDSISTADSLVLSEERYRHASLLSYYSFFITVQGTLLGLPSPVPRKSQKLGKATYWDVQKNLRQRMDMIGELRSWLGVCPEQLGRPLTFNDSEDGPSNSRFKRYKFSNQSQDTFRDISGRGDARSDAPAQSCLMGCNSLSLTTEVLPLLAKILPDGYPHDLRQLPRMRFEYAGISDLALKALGEHDVSLEQDESTDPLPKVADATLTEPRTRPPKIESKMYLSEDDIDDF